MRALVKWAVVVVLALGMVTPSVGSEQGLLIAHAHAMAAKYGIPTNLLRAVCHVESNWRNVPGSHQEIGVCQIKPNTVAMICRPCRTNPEKIVRDLWDPRDNIEWAAKYLAWLKRNVSPDPLIMAAAYNGGPASPAVDYMLKIRRAGGV